MSESEMVSELQASSMGVYELLIRAMVSSTTETEGGPPSPLAAPPFAGKVDSDMSSTDFRILPIPKRLRYDPDKPFHFGLLLNVSFGFASTFGACSDQHDRPFLTSSKSSRIYTTVSPC